jgi:hypothetical protein
VDPNATGFSPFGGTSAARPRKQTESTSGSKSLVRKDSQGNLSLTEPGGRPAWMVPAGMVGALLVGGLAVAALWPKPPPPVKVVSPDAEVTPKPPAQAQLSVESDPPGAAVRVDGRDLGVTPIEGKAIPSGSEVRLELSKDGYQTLVEHPKLEPGPQRLHYALVKAAPPKATVQLASDPSGAEVYLGEQKLGNTPYAWVTDAAPDQVTLTFKLAGYKPTEARVGHAQDNAITVSLAKLVHKPSGSGGKEKEPALEIKTGR